MGSRGSWGLCSQERVRERVQQTRPLLGICHTEAKCANLVSPSQSAPPLHWQHPCCFLTREESLSFVTILMCVGFFLRFSSFVHFRLSITTFLLVNGVLRSFLLTLF